MKQKNIRQLSLSAMFLSAALVLPFLTGQIPEVGNMLLPMHLPVILCGLICGAKWGVSVGAIAPLMRSLIFGKPLLFPSAVAMAFELAAYGLVVGLIFSRAKHKCIFSLLGALISSMVCGRIVWGAVMAVLMGFNGFTLSFFLTEAVINAIPGIILQIFLIPTIMLLLRKTHLVGIIKEKSKKQIKVKEYFEIAEEIRRIHKRQGRVTVAIDGRCGSGKSTLAEYLSQELGATVFHTDDFFLPWAMRTAERLGEIGGNFHRERFEAEVLLPVSKGARVEYRRYNCINDTFATPQIITPSEITVIEGSYALHPEIRRYYHIKVFSDVKEETQKARITERDGARAEMFFEKWIPLEERYFTEFKIRESSDIIINQG